MEWHLKKKRNFPGRSRFTSRFDRKLIIHGGIDFWLYVDFSDIILEPIIMTPDQKQAAIMNSVV